MAGASWVSISDQSPTRSGVQADGAQNSFNYSGPVMNLPSVQRSSSFWVTRLDARSRLMQNGQPDDQPGAFGSLPGGIVGTAGVSWLGVGLALAAAGAVWWLWRKG